MISKNKVVQLHYTLTDDSGNQIENTKGNEHLEGCVRNCKADAINPPQMNADWAAVPC